MTKHIEKAEIKLRLGDMLFTWDDEKEKINIRKHGIDFTVQQQFSLMTMLPMTSILLIKLQVKNVEALQYGLQEK
ncbi:MAG: BrnT family toxin [Synergistaceae bacterium]|nr:BrnT family toxin [Synergistaceae bacterium]